MTAKQNSKALHISLWVAQILLALAFGMSGFMKISMPIADLAANGLGFVTRYSEGMVRFIGTMEVLAALGLILPAALRIKTALTPLAAVGLALIMILAINEHVSQDEPIVPNIILFAIASFIAWGRFKAAPIQSKK